MKKSRLVTLDKEGQLCEMMEKGERYIGTENSPNPLIVRDPDFQQVQVEDPYIIIPPYVLYEKTKDTSLITGNHYQEYFIDHIKKNLL